MRLIKKFIQYRKLVIRLHNIQLTTANRFELSCAITRLNRLDRIWNKN